MKNHTKGIVVGPICLLIELVFILVRQYARFFVQKKTDLSDVLIPLGWISSVLMNVADYYIFKLGGWDVPIRYEKDGTFPNFEVLFPDVGSRVMMLKAIYFCGLTSWVGFYCIKGTFLLLYLQIFPPLLRKLRVALYFGVVFSCIGLLVTFNLNAFYCQPISRNWSSKHDNLCMSQPTPKIYITDTTFHVLSDIFVYAIPFFLFAHLTLSRSEKIQLIAAFSFGGICILASIGRIFAVSLFTNFVVIEICNNIEFSVGLIIACCPAIKWLYKHNKDQKLRKNDKLRYLGSSPDGEHKAMRVNEIDLEVATPRSF